MKTQLALEKAEKILNEIALSLNRPEENRLDVHIAAENLKRAVKAMLIDHQWGYLSAITGMDKPEYVVDETTRVKTPVPGVGSLEVLYHFCEGAAVVTLRVLVPYDNPLVDSICDLMPGASLYEREAMELLGIEFVGTPDRSRLVLPESWPDGVYPLRKTFTGLAENAKPLEGR